MFKISIAHIRSKSILSYMIEIKIILNKNFSILVAKILIYELILSDITQQEFWQEFKLHFKVYLRGIILHSGYHTNIIITLNFKALF